jgi:hypothetical protein
MSDIQYNAGLRWLFLCLRHGGRADFKQARQHIPGHFLLTDEERKINASREEPAWLQAMRNFKRDVAQGKHPYFRVTGDGLSLSPAGRQLINRVINQTNSSNEQSERGSDLFRKPDLKVASWRVN